MRTQPKRCVHCGRRYEAHVSGYPDPGIVTGTATHCNSCATVIDAALSNVRRVSVRAWIETSDTPIQTLINHREELIRAAEAKGSLLIQQVFVGLIDLQRPANRHVQEAVRLDGRSYRYEFWSERRPETEKVFTEVEIDPFTKEIKGPWRLDDSWPAPPVFVQPILVR